MSDGTSAPPRPPGRRSDRLHAVGAGTVAVLTVLAGILVVNLLNGPSDPDDSGSPVTAPSRPTGGDQSSAPTGPTTASPSPRRSPTPSATASRSTPQPATPKPAAVRTAAPPAATRPAPRATAPVVVLNNSRIAGLADQAAAQVEAAGFTVERVGNYVSIYDVPVTTVFYDDPDADAAQALKDAVPGIERTVPRSQTRIISTDTLILVVTRDFPVGTER